MLLDRDCVLLLFDLQLHFLVAPLAGPRPDLARFREEHTHFVRYLEQTASLSQVREVMGLVIVLTVVF